MLVTDNSINSKNYPKTNKEVIVSWGDIVDISQNDTKNTLSQVVNFVGIMSTPASFWLLLWLDMILVNGHASTRKYKIITEN